MKNLILYFQISALFLFMFNPTPAGAECDAVLMTVNNNEGDAVLATFRNETGHDAITDYIDGTTYRYLGVIQTRYYRVAFCHVRSNEGSDSPGASMTTAMEAVRVLNPSAFFMVGVAMGMDNATQSIGQVIVSTAVIPYDHKKVDNTSKITARDLPARASQELLDYLKDAVQDLDDKKLKVRFCPILSGQTLVDNVDVRDQLKKVFSVYNPCAKEMEGNGFSTAISVRIPWIIIKGICDWGDGNKSHDKVNRQITAARNVMNFVTQSVKKNPFPFYNPDKVIHFKRETTNGDVFYHSLFKLLTISLSFHVRQGDKYFRIPTDEHVSFQVKKNVLHLDILQNKTWGDGLTLAVVYVRVSKYDSLELSPTSGINTILQSNDFLVEMDAACSGHLFGTNENWGARMPNFNSNFFDLRSPARTVAMVFEVKMCKWKAKFLRRTVTQDDASLSFRA